MTEPDDAVVVTQEDREWARGFLAGGELYWNEDDMAHALARHRQQALATLEAEVERLKEALKDIAGAVRLGPSTDLPTWRSLAMACQLRARQASRRTAMPGEPDDAVVEAMAKALREFDLSEANAGLLTDEEFRGFYHNAARAAIAAARPLIEREALEKAAGVAERRVEIGMRSTGVVNNALLQALPDAIRALASSEQGEG